MHEKFMFLGDCMLRAYLFYRYFFYNKKKKTSHSKYGKFSPKLNCPSAASHMKIPMSDNIRKEARDRAGKVLSHSRVGSTDREIYILSSKAKEKEERMQYGKEQTPDNCGSL